MVLCDRDPAGRRNPTEVANILARHHDHGRTPTQIARETGRSRSTISRIISDAALLEQFC
ncbi:helix-turn-helix domain-containing protein [Nocardia jiangxiensis]|uniref:Helix-turn-helix domain-containing protein n=1 Tax=Nocardia jiangxiensis TaxID=282685 RepID=A0ABW6S342_9NOCA